MAQLQSVRRSHIAGSWYPGSQKDLKRTVDRYLANVRQPHLPGELLGLITPHAGYTYSGQTAAHAYRQLDGMEIDTVVLLGPSHRAPVRDSAINEEDAYETPLGQVPLDHDFVDDLAERLPLQRVRQDSEHSLEIQLPFLQRQLSTFRLVPIIIGTGDPKVAAILGAALAETIRDRSTNGARHLLIASSDLHHIDDYDEVVRRDKVVVDAVAAYDTRALAHLFADWHCSVCGRMPILAVLHAARALGAGSVRVLDHTTSGDVTGERQRGQYTVGYMAAAIYRSG